MADKMNELRQCHYVRKLTSSSSPSNMVFFDTETFATPLPARKGVELHNLRCFVACHIVMDNGKVKSEVWRMGHTPDEFWQFLESCHVKKKRLYCFAHNLGFDLSSLHFWEVLESGRFRLHSRNITSESGVTEGRGCTVLEDPPTIIDTLHVESNSRVTFVDTLNYWRCSLAKIGESINLPKMDMPQDTDNWELWFCYCRRDVRILVEALLGLIRKWKSEELGPFRLTATGLSYNAFRSRFMSHQIMVHGHKLALELERNCYYVGYNACNYVGQCGQYTFQRDYDSRSLLSIPCAITHGSVYHLDINSMYPSIMRSERYPAKLRSYDVCSGMCGPLQEGDTYNIAAWVRVRSKNNTYPKRINGRTVFVCGCFDTWLCGPELYQGILDGDVTQVHCYCTYDMQPIFTNFVDYFWDMRQSAKTRNNEVQREFAKLVMNSLSGKFAQRAGRWSYNSKVMCPSEWGTFYLWDNEHGRPQPIRSIAGHGFVENVRGEAAESVPIISAFITSYARSYIRSLEKLAGNHNVFYVDTDSLFCTLDGYENLVKRGYVDEKELGKLKLVGIYDYCEFRGLKDYTTSESHVIAGMKSSASWNPDGSFTQLEFQRLKSILQSRPSGSIIVREVTKRIGNAHVTGRVGRDGWVSPMVLEE